MSVHTPMAPSKNALESPPVHHHSHHVALDSDMGVDDASMQLLAASRSGDASPSSLAGGHDGKPSDRRGGDALGGAGGSGGGSVIKAPKRSLAETLELTSPRQAATTPRKRGAFAQD